MRLGRRSSAMAGVVLAAALLAGCGTGPAVTLPQLPAGHGAVATLTGYAKTSPSDEGGVATSVHLTAAEASALTRAIESLGVVPRGQCMENQLLFNLTITSHGATWAATALLCPVPGQIDVGGTTYQATCAVIRLAASYLPEGTSGACYPTRT